MNEMRPDLLSWRSSTALRLRHIAQSPSYRYFTALQADSSTGKLVDAQA
jgi:hypothetical protein